MAGPRRVDAARCAGPGGEWIALLSSGNDEGGAEKLSRFLRGKGYLSRIWYNDFSTKTVLKIIHSSF